MKRLTRVLSLLTVLLFSAVCLRAQPSQTAPDFGRVLALIDSNSTFPKTDFSAVILLKTDDPEKGHSEEKVATFRRDSMDAFIMLTIEPAAKKGQGLLLVDKDLWMYDPVSRKFTHSSLKDGYGDSSARNSDFRSSSKAEDYEVKAYTSGVLGKYDCWIVDLKARRDDVTYPFMRMWVSKSDYLELKAEEYSLSGRLLRTSFFPSWARIGDKYVATRSIYQDGLVAGKRTELLVSDISTKALSDEMFTKSYLEKVGR